MPELCKAYTPGKADQDLNARITRLEQIVEMALPQFCVPDASSSYSVDRNSSTGPARHRTSSSGEDDSNSQNEEQDTRGGIFQSGNWYGASASGSVVPASVIEQVTCYSRLLKMLIVNRGDRLSTPVYRLPVER